jgi:hypothetical protein
MVTRASISTGGIPSGGRAFPIRRAQMGDSNKCNTKVKTSLHYLIIIA